MIVDCLNQNYRNLSQCLIAVMLLCVSSLSNAWEISDPITVTENPSYDGTYLLSFPDTLWSGLENSLSTTATLTETYTPTSGVSVNTTTSLDYSQNNISLTGKPVGTYTYFVTVQGPYANTTGGGDVRNTSDLVVQVLPASQAPTPTPTAEPTPTPTPAPTPVASSSQVSYDGRFTIQIPDSAWSNVTDYTSVLLTERYENEFGSQTEYTYSNGFVPDDADDVDITGKLPGIYTYSLVVKGQATDINGNPQNGSGQKDTYDFATVEVIPWNENDPDPFPPSGKFDLSKYDIYYGDFNDDGIDGDIYLHGRDVFVLIAGDVSVPLLLDGPRGIVFYNFNTGYFGPLWLDLDKSELSNFTRAKLNYDFYTADFDGNNQTDYFIRGAENGAPALSLLQTSTGFPSSISYLIDEFDVSNRGVTLKFEDYNLDGRDDLLQMSSSDGYILDVLYSSSNGSLSSSYNDAASVSEMFSFQTYSGNVTGTLGGNFRVSETGAATYSIPILTPAGSGASTPSVSLSYSSQSGGGILGDGWSLNAFSAVTRCRKTYDIDREVNAITFTDNDEFCLDGQRLILVSGVHGANNAEYRTEIDSYAIVTIRGTNERGEPDFFTVEKKDGSISFYGYAEGDAIGTNSKQTLSSSSASTISWYLSRVEDNAGNPIQYFYKHNAGKDFRLDRIEYAYGDNGQPDGINPNTTIYFDYEKRPDLIKGYLGGYAISQQYRLTRIDVNNFVNSDKTIRTYHIFYNRDLGGSVRKHSMIGAIQECVGAQCKRATRFQWDLVAGDYESNASSSFDPGTDKSFIREFKTPDINGDGVQDLVWLAMEEEYNLIDGSNVNHEMHYALSINGQLVKQSFDDGNPLKTFYEDQSQVVKLEILDYNADGRSDVAVYRSKGANAGGWEIYLAVPGDSEGSTWKLDYDSFDSGVDGQEIKFLDVNGDGLSDAVGEEKVYFLKRRYGSDPSEAEYKSNKFYTFGAAESNPWIGVSNDLSEAAWRRVYKRNESYGDFNGDGRMDLIVANGQFDLGNCGGICFDVTARKEYFYVLIQTELGLYRELTIASKNSGNSYSETDFANFKPWAVDLNRDGLSDVLFRDGSSVYAYFSTGTGFTSRIQVSGGLEDRFESQVQFVDYNQDGYQDIVEFTGSGSQSSPRLFLWNNNASKFENRASLNNGLNGSRFDARAFSDINGDGLPDYVGFHGGEFKTHLFRSDYQKKPQIVSFDTGSGAKTEITYERLNDTDHYSGLDINPVENGTSEHCVLTGFRGPLKCTDYTLFSADNFYYALNKGLNTSNVFVNPLAPLQELNGPMYVVTQVESASPSTNIADDVTSPGGNTGGASVNTSSKASVSYFYNEAKVQAGGRGTLGFHQLSTVDNQTGVETLTIYRQDFPFVGSPVSTIVYSPSNDIISESHNVYGIKALAPNASSLVQAGGTSAISPIKTYLEASYEVSYATSSSVNTAGAISVEVGSGVSQTCITNMTDCPVFSEAASTQKVLQETVTRTDIDNDGNIVNVSVETRGAGLSQTVVTQNEYGDSTDNIIITRSDSSLNRSYSFADLGRLTKSTVSRVRGSVTEPDEVTEFTYFTSDSESGYAGMLLTESVSPDGPANENLVTTYSYDAFGNIKQKTLSGWDGSGTIDGDSIESAERVARTEFDPTGRYINATFVGAATEGGAEHKVSEVVARNEYGAATQTNDVNGMINYVDYDSWGREIYAGNNVGSGVNTQYLFCPNSTISCPSHAKTAVVSRRSDSGDVIRAIAYYDLMGREVRTSSLAFNGYYINVDTEYDVLGRVVRKSEPYFSPETVSLWTRSYYDELGRVILTKAPDGSEGKVAYNGYTSTSTNALNQTKISRKNAFGELEYVEAEDGGTIDYSYTTKGELRTTTANQQTATHYSYGEVSGLCQQPTSNYQTVLCYDSLGRKTAMWDPDKGYWSYEYNAFGELIRQTDANGQAIHISYDLRGRKKSRTDYTATDTVEGHTSWYYDSEDDLQQHVGNAIMQTTAITYTSDGGSYIKRFGYDYFGQPLSTTVVLPDNNIYETYLEYDYEKGRIHKQHDVLSGVLKRDGEAVEVGIENHYTDNGFLEKITNLEDGAEVYEPIGYSARGQLRKASIGGMITIGSDYYDETGLLKEKLAIAGMSTQSLYYEWDLVGNLKHRETMSNALGLSSANKMVEDFCYDSMNRLVKTYKNTTNAVCPNNSAEYDIAINQFGNIVRKNGTLYNYGEVNAGHKAGPHAVTSFGYSTGGNTIFSYDNNGNLLNDGSRTFSYSTFNKPVEIRNSSHTVQFEYGADRKRFHRVDISDAGTEHTWYLGNLEKIVKGGTIKWRRRLEGGAHYTYTTDSNNNETSPIQKRYLVSDHLGSANIMFTANGSVATSDSGTPQLFGFNEWGLRRDAKDFSALTNSELINFDNSVTKRGFTGHEMVDTLFVVHMNGRIYDPRWGRFLQADPFVQAPTDTQSLNRYSYVRNNPLNATDPEGYFWFELAWGAVVGYISQKAATATNTPIIGVVGSVIGCVSSFGTNTPSCAAGLGFGSTYGATGDLSKSVQNGAISGASAWAFSKVGGMAESASSRNQINVPNQPNLIHPGAVSFAGNYLLPHQVALQIAAHAVIGGIAAELQGGKFGHGFISAGVTKSAMGSMFTVGYGGVVGRTTIAAVIGGTVSDITGGKFANGAATAALAHIFNAEGFGQVREGFEYEIMGAYPEDVAYLKYEVYLKEGKNIFISGVSTGVTTDGKVKIEYLPPKIRQQLKARGIALQVDASMNGKVEVALGGGVEQIGGFVFASSHGDIGVKINLIAPPNTSQTLKAGANGFKLIESMKVFYDNTFKAMYNCAITSACSM
ncbi:RHS repeat-associated protein [Alteromonadaceae bacterium 2753L.S.0a.02]|nr:RHS repeat-associated protein [Alteromonadaceae bacterium 2753L.S.0a.02]